MNKLTMNDKISIDIMNIDPDIILLLKKNKIKTIADFMKINPENYAQSGTSSKEQLEWAQSFFNFESLENMPKDANQMTVAKVVVDDANKAKTKIKRR